MTSPPNRLLPKPIEELFNERLEADWTNGKCSWIGFALSSVSAAMSFYLSGFGAFLATAVAVWNFNSTLPKLFTKSSGLFSFGEGCLVLQAASVCVAKAFLRLTGYTVDGDDSCKVKTFEETLMVGLLVLFQLPRPLRHISVMSISYTSPLSIF